jgi:hypothetical protein
VSVFDRTQCQVYWGSHGCWLWRGHEGNHECRDKDEAAPHLVVSREGVDERGLQWNLYGDDVGWQTYGEDPREQPVWESTPTRADLDAATDLTEDE